MMHVARCTRRWALLLVALSFLAVALAACGLPGDYPLSTMNAALVSTPIGGSSPTPAFSPFTIGAWPSNSMPEVGESVTIYVICQLQDPTMASSSKPAAGQTVYVRLLDPVNRTFKGATDGGGIAKVRIAYSHARAQTPITIIVTTSWKGKTYQSGTSFTPTSPTSPTGPSEDGTPQPGATPPSATATPGSQPEPTATPLPSPPAPTPTPTSNPEPTATPLPPIPPTLAPEAASAATTAR
jgi:hypothetical protein